MASAVDDAGAVVCSAPDVLAAPDDVGLAAPLVPAAAVDGAAVDLLAVSDDAEPVGDAPASVDDDVVPLLPVSRPLPSSVA